MSKVNSAFLTSDWLEELYYDWLFHLAAMYRLSSCHRQNSCQQRLHLLRKLNSFGVRKDILLTFYHSFIESAITFSIPCWFYSVSLQYRNLLQSTVKVCSQIIGLPLRNLTSQCDQHTGSLAQKIVKDPSHPLHTVLEWLPSKRRLRCPCCKTQRRRRSFVPRAVLLLNT
uniref:Alkylated DNA repair protein AlkB homologue 8 N-terminal domain-containing protein n=1 Tax=Nothobranchius pienaari TaxID=704102 RepID=A0A1A8LEW2_9TELE